MVVSVVSEATGTGAAVKVHKGTSDVSSFVTLACLSSICVLASSVRLRYYKFILSQ